MLTQTAIGIRTPNTSRTCASELSKNRATCNCSKSTHLRVYWRTTPCLAHERQEPNKNEITTKHTLQHFETKPSYKKKVCKCAVQFSKIRRIKQRNPHRESPQVGPLVCRANALANCRTLLRLRFALVLFFSYFLWDGLVILL